MSSFAAERGGQADLRGQATVELSLVLVLLLLLSAGVIDLGRALHASLVVSQAARDGARVAMNESDDGRVRAVVISVAAPLDISTVDVVRETALYPTVTVLVTHAYQPMLPISGLWGGEPFQIRAEMTARIEGG